MKMKPVNLDDITISFGDREVKPIAYEVSADSYFNTAKITFTVHLNELMQGTCKVENRPIDEGKTDKGLDIREATDRTEIERLKADTDRVLKILSDSLVRLQANVCQLEKKVERLENANSDTGTDDI